MTEFWIAVAAIIVSGILLSLVSTRAQKRKVKREAARVLKDVQRNVYKVQHNLHEIEPLVTLYDAVTSAVIPATEYQLILDDDMALEVRTDYERPFRVVVVSASGEYRRCTFIPTGENP